MFGDLFNLLIFLMVSALVLAAPLVIILVGMWLRRKQTGCVYCVHRIKLKNGCCPACGASGEAEAPGGFEVVVDQK